MSLACDTFFPQKQAKGGRSGCSTSLSCLYHKCVKQTVGLYFFFNQLQIMYDLYVQLLWIESAVMGIYQYKSVEVVVLILTTAIASQCYLPTYLLCDRTQNSKMLE